MSRAATLSLCRRLLRELSKSHPQQARESQLWGYVKASIRQHQKQVMEAGGEEASAAAQRVLQTYLCYMESSRSHRELLLKYKGRGERSVDESARMVGLGLPPTQTSIGGMMSSSPPHTQPLGETANKHCTDQ